MPPRSRRTPQQNSAVQKRNKAQTVERDAEVWRLHIQGQTLRQIGQKVGLHHTTVMDIINKGVAETRDPLIGEIRKVADERVNWMWSKLVPAIDAGDVQAIEVGRKLIESWRKLHAADGPVTINVNETSQTDLALQEMIREAEMQVAAREAEIQGRGSGDVDEE
jgi:hypothetical protein